MRLFVTFFALLILLGGVAQLPAQAQLEGELVIDSVVGDIIQMRLIVTNIGDQPFFHVFPDSEISFFSLNGEEIHYGSLPVVLPFTLQPGASFTFDMTSFDPLPFGVYVVQAFLSIYDAQNHPMAMGAPQTVYIGEGEWITVGSGDLLSRVPIDFFWRTTLYECVFTPADLDYLPGIISMITFYNDFSQQPFLFQQVRVYLAGLAQADLSEGWINPDALVLVFDGLLDFRMGMTAINIPLPNAYYYNGWSNLGLVVWRLIPSSYQFGAEPFSVQEADPLRSRKLYSDYLNLDPMLSPAANPSQHVGIMPMTSFHIYPGGSTADEVNVPSRISVAHYPNPVRERCEIELKLEKPAIAKVEIYNLKGQKVRALESGVSSSEHRLSWDLKDESGTPCAAGIYLYMARADKENAAGKLIILP
ncbi:MAG: T9SS type A sorting domain-containing protein [Candidatus Cloacimonadaceae bacterium]|nr:T9SS type A sorting domain-containing protein [Candidatus Cloacimonadaceae bacterium]